jgi:hypothetical protein
MRLYNDEDYVASKAQLDEPTVDENAPPEQKLKTLLEEHGYAYVPNKVRYHQYIYSRQCQ